MLVPSPVVVQDLIDQLLPAVPSTLAPLHLLPKLQGPVALLRYWNAHLCSEIRRAAQSKSIRWEKLEEKDRRILKRMISVRCERDFDEKGEAFLLILASWHIQHYLLMNPRAHQNSLRLVNLWFPPSPLPSSYFIGEPSMLDPKTVHATNTKYSKFRTNALVKVQGVRKLINKNGGSAENLAEALKREAEAPTVSSLRFDFRLQWESESAGLSNWAKKVVQLWLLMDRLFPLLPGEAPSGASPHEEETKVMSMHTSTSVLHKSTPDPTILSFSTPNHSVPLRQRSLYPYTNDSTYTPSIYPLSSTTSVKLPRPPARSDSTAATYPSSKSDGNSEPNFEARSRHFPCRSSPSTSPFIEQQVTAPLDDFVADSQSFGSLTSSYSHKGKNVADTSLEDISDIEIISPRAIGRIQSAKPLISSSPSTSYLIHIGSRSKEFFNSSRAPPPRPPPRQTAAPHRTSSKDVRIVGSRRKSGGRPRLSFEPDFDLSIVPPEPKANTKSRLCPEQIDDVSSERIPVGAIEYIQPPIDHTVTLPEEQPRVIELISSSPIDEEIEDDESLPVADSQEVLDSKPSNELRPSSSPESPAHSLPKKAAAAFSFPKLSPGTKRAHRSLLYLPNQQVVYTSSSGSDSDPISDSSEDDSQDELVGLNHRTILRASGLNSNGRMIRQANVRLKRKRDSIKNESEESEHEQGRFWLAGQRKLKPPSLKEEEEDPVDQLKLFTQGGRAGSLDQSTNPNTSSSAFNSELLDSSFLPDGRDSESESAVSSLIADDPTYSSSDEEEDTTTTMIVTGSIDVQDSQETNPGLGHTDILVEPGWETQSRFSLSPIL